MPILQSTLKDLGFTLNRKEETQENLDDVFTSLNRVKLNTVDQIPLSSINKTIPPNAIDFSRLTLDKLYPTQNVGTSNFEPGTTGWRIWGNGDAEFGNLTSRGVIRTSVFEKDTVNAVGGSLLISTSDVLDENMTALNAATLTTRSDAFAIGTILRLKDTSNDEWLEVTGVTGLVHTVTRDLAGDYASDNNPEWQKGTAVVSFAKADEGFIDLNASSTNSPFVKVFKRNSATYDDYDLKCMMGNLKDATGTEEYGFWAEGSSLYLGGYKQYDMIVNKEGTGGATKVFYGGTSYSSIVAALDAAQTAGATEITMFLRKGTYTENEKTAGWNMEVNLVGEDQVSTIISFDTAQKYWRFNKDITIRNLSVTGNSDGVCLIQAIGSDHVLIDHCIMNNNFSEADGAGCIYIGDPTDVGDTNVRITNNTFSAPSALTDNPLGVQSVITMNGDRGDVQIVNNRIVCSGNGIWFKGDATNQQNFVMNNAIGMIASDSLTRGIGIISYGTGLTKTLISGNVIFVVSGAGDYPIGININGDATVFQENRVVDNSVIAAVNGYVLESAGIVCGNNQAKGCIDNGIFVKGGNASADNINNIVNNSIYDCGGDGISLDVSNFNITGNSIHNCSSGIGDSESTAIHENIICSSNEIRDCGNGITIQCSSGAFPSYNFIFSNNYIAGDASQTTGIGIGLGSAVSNVNIDGNIIRNFELGIGFQQRYDSECGYVNIANNDIEDMDSKAIAFVDYSVSPLKIMNNKVYDGIVVEYLTSGSIISGNHIYGSAGIVVSATMTGAEISGNTIDVSTDNGILVTGDVNEGRFYNNYIDTQAEGACGIKCDASIYNCIFTGNRIDSEIIGIRVATDMDNSIFSSNWIQYDAAGYGIAIVGNVDTSTSETEGSVFNGNHIQHDDTTGATECIYIGGNARNLVVSGNRLYAGASGNYAMTIVGTTNNCLFTGNRNSHSLTAGTIGAGFQGTGARTGNVEASNLMT